MGSWTNATTAPPPAVGILRPELQEALVRRDRFELSMKTIRVAVPDDLLGARATPAGRLVVTHTPSGSQPVEYAYRQEGEGKRDRGDGQAGK